jgi:arylsulfatase A-like enzyme
LAAKNLGENVLFIHTSDHGTAMPFGKWNLYDYSTRVPFIAAWPGKIKGGVRSDAMASWIDLLPTLVDLVGGTNPEGIDGKSFAPVLLGQSTTHRDTVFSTHSGANYNTYPIRMIRKKNWKLLWNLYSDNPFTSQIDQGKIEYHDSFWQGWEELIASDSHAKAVIERYRNRPEFELYDMQRDPNEMNNLALNAEYAELVTKLKGELEAWMDAQGDQRTLVNAKQRKKESSGKKKNKAKKPNKPQNPE